MRPIWLKKNGGSAAGARRSTFPRLPSSQAAHQAAQKPVAGPRFDLRAGGLDQASVLDARGAGRFAAAAGQAQADMFLIGGRNGAAIRHLDHLVDSAARGIHLQSQLAIGRTGVEAETAVDTAVEIGLLRPVRSQIR